MKWIGKSLPVMNPSLGLKSQDLQRSRSRRLLVSYQPMEAQLHNNKHVAVVVDHCWNL